MRTILLALSLSLTAACDTPVEIPAVPDAVIDKVVDAAPIPEQVTKAAKIAMAVRADPSKAEAVLKENGMTEADLDALMYEIASDPMLSAAYTKATGK